MNELIDLTKSEQYTLSIRLGVEAFSWMAYSPLEGGDFLFRTRTVNEQCSMAANLKEFLMASDELKQPYRQVNLLIETARYTIVPLELYEDDRMEMLFYQNLLRRENEVVLCNILSKSNTVILFGIDKLTHLLLTEHFPKARIFATVSPLVEYFTFKSRQGNNRKVFANIRNSEIDVLAFERGRLLLLNTYPAQTCDDKCYYLLHVWKQLAYEGKQDDVFLTGSEAGKKEVAARLKTFLPRVFIVQPDAAFSRAISGRIEDVPFDIQALLLCE